MAALAGLIVVIALAWWVLVGSPWFRVRTVDVQGVSDAAQRSAVVAAANVPTGEALVKVDTQAAADRVAGIGTVAKVDVTRHAPSTVVITVQPREPVVAVRQGGSLRVADRDGVIFATTSSGSAPAGVPVVTVENGAPSDALRSAATTVLALPEKTRSKVSKIVVDQQGDITFTDGSVKVVWGTADDAAVKASVLEILAARPGVGTVNVSAPDVPVTTP